MKNNKKFFSFVVIAALFLQVSYGFLISRVSALSLTQTLVRFDRMSVSTFTSGLVCAQPAATATETSVKVTFPTGYTVSATAGNWTVSTASTAGWPAGAVAWPGIAAPTGAGEFVISGQSVNFQSGDLTAGTYYCFAWTNDTAALQTKATATANNTGTIITQTTGGAASDTGSYATSTVTSDQVVVSAAIGSTFNFVLDANTTSFVGNLDEALVQQTTGRTMTVTTNANNGWIAWAKSLNTGLTSAAAANTIASTTPGTAATLSPGTEGYIVSTEVTTDSAGGGTVSIPTAYQGTAGNANGSGLDTTFRQVATSTGPAGGTGDVVTIRGKASIDGSTPAANDYTDTWTIIGAGSF